MVIPSLLRLGGKRAEDTRRSDVIQACCNDKFGCAYSRLVSPGSGVPASVSFDRVTKLYDLDPRRRDVAMVFQNYALYPHMTVFENIAFGLRARHVPKAEITRRVE